MSDYHSVYKGPEGETTQWQDIQRKLGNYAEAAPVSKPPPFEPAVEKAKDKDWLDSKEAAELEQLDDDFDDDRTLENYRRQRIAELKAAAGRPRFGAMTEIRGSDFVEQVTNAGEGIWVVTLLYKDSVEACGLLLQCFEELARKYPSTKFLKIVSTDCIPSYPDRNLPTVLIYHDTKCEHHIVGLMPWGGKGITPEGVALALNYYGNICAADDGNFDTHTITKKHLQGLVERIAQQHEDDESSDFDD